MKPAMVSSKASIPPGILLSKILRKALSQSLCLTSSETTRAKTGRGGADAADATAAGAT